MLIEASMAESGIQSNDETGLQTIENEQLIVSGFYEGINSRNLSMVADLIAEDCAYEDLVLPQPFISRKKTFSFTLRDSLINVGPLKDFSYGLRMNADPNAIGVAKQSNYELVCCSGHGKNDSLCVLQQSIRPEIITQVSQSTQRTSHCFIGSYTRLQGALDSLSQKLTQST